MEIGSIAVKPPVICLATIPVAQVARMMREHNVGSVIVTDLDERPIGIVTDRDLAIRVLAAEVAPSDEVGVAMTHQPVTISERADSLDAARHMAERECRRLPVVNEAGKVIGIVTFDDLLIQAGHTIEELARVASILQVQKTLALHSR